MEMFEKIGLSVLGAVTILVISLAAAALYEAGAKVHDERLAHAAFIESCVQEQKLYRCEIQYRGMKQ